MDFTDNRSAAGRYAAERARIKAYIESHLKEHRLRHTYSVVEEAKKLAGRYGGDMEKAELAALFHDMFRGRPETELDRLVKRFGLPKHLIGRPNLSHGKLAAIAMERDYNIDDADIVNAVSFHTTGRAGMSKLEKIIFLADAIEPLRQYPAVQEIRTLAYVDLDQACIRSLERTIAYIRERGEYLDPDTQNALNDLKEKVDL